MSPFLHFSRSFGCVLFAFGVFCCCFACSPDFVSLGSSMGNHIRGQDTIRAISYIVLPSFSVSYMILAFLSFRVFPCLYPLLPLLWCRLLRILQLDTTQSPLMLFCPWHNIFALLDPLLPAATCTPPRRPRPLQTGAYPSGAKIMLASRTGLNRPVIVDTTSTLPPKF